MPVERGHGGYLVIKKPWPGMFRTLYEDDERYVSNYFSRFDESTYFPGDGARQDADGDFWLLGRVDDVMNVSGIACPPSSWSRRWSSTRRWRRPQRPLRPTR